MSESCQDGNCHGNNEFGPDESPTKLIVNYIPEVMTQDMMFSLFSTMGKLESCKLIANRGYGFVEYSRPEDAIKARKAFNGLLMQNKTLKVSHALLNPELKPPTKPEADWNLYVCNLPNELTLQDLHGLFAQFGKIVNSRIAAGIAFVLFEHQYEAERAMQNINATTPPGFLHPLTVKYANKSNPHKHKNNNNNTFVKNVLVKPYHWINHFNAIGDHNSPSTWSIYIYNIAPEVEELTLWQLFGPYGAIVSVKIIKDHQTNKSKGFGFVTMRNYDQAAMAIQALNGYVLHSQPLSDNKLWGYCFSVHSAALADVETPAAAGGVGLTVSSKVYPSPGAARGVWALPQPPPCTMAAEEPLPPCSPMSPDAPAAPPRAITSLYHHSDLHQLIFEAVRSGEVCEIERLVEKLGVEVLSARDQHGYTPAHWAALDGCVAVMRYLVERAAPVDLSCLGTQGPRPIHWACRKGHASVVQVLLQSGVAVNAADFKGLTPLMTACMYGKTATAAYLLGMGAATRLSDINGDTALHWAAYKGHADLVRLLIYSGVPLHCTDNFGSTPLHLACLSGNLTCVRLLCEKVKAELEPRDKNGKTPLMLAQSHRHAEVVKLLQKEMKRKSHWMPPLSELWALLFGGAGDSKGPLLFFLVSVLLWGYPMYVIRCIPLTWNTLRLSHYCFLYWNGIMWLSWVIANRRDPGYIPQNSETYYRAIRQIPYYDKWKKRNTILSRLCHTCRCLRPLRAKHCRICKRCVAYFDHHCPFIYNCVGVRNRMWFFLFVMSVAINCTLSIYFACYCLLLEGFGLLYVLGLLEAITFCALGWILTCTSILHACMNLTTNEMFNYKRYPYLRDKRGRYQNPFSRGPIMNLIEFFVCLPDKCDEQDIFHEESI